MIRAIAHPTDFSDAASDAFLHALALALAHRCRLDLLHVGAAAHAEAWDNFPHVRDALRCWGRLDAGAGVEDILPATGVSVRKAEIQDRDPVQGLSRYFWTHRPDLIVMASHGRTGLRRWLRGSISEDVLQAGHVPALVLGPKAAGFVDRDSGDLDLGRVLVPVTDRPHPERALLRLHDIVAPFRASLDLVHVGNAPPKVISPSGAPTAVRALGGAAVETILSQGRGAALIAMPTQGRHGFLDAVRGTTTEQVLRQASCPLLTLPA